MMLLRANVLALGFSGIRLEVIELLTEMLNRGVHPVVPEKGSVGASGDLAPLAHLALTLIGEGEAFYDDKRLGSGEALKQAEASAGHSSKQRKGSRFSMARRRCTPSADWPCSARFIDASRRHRRRDDSRSAEGNAGRFRRAHSRCAAASGPAGGRAHLLELLRDSEIRESHAQRRSARAGRLQSALHAAGARRGPRRARSLRGSSAQSNPAPRPTTRSCSPTMATSFPAEISTARRSPSRSITRRSR